MSDVMTRRIRGRTFASAPGITGVLSAGVIAWVVALSVLSPTAERSPWLVFGLWLSACATALLIRCILGGLVSQRGMRALDLIVFNLCLTTVVAEVAFRSLARSRPSILLMRPEAGVVDSVEGARFAPGAVRHGFPVNRSGHYDDDAASSSPNRALVTSIGDSFSAGVVHHSLHFTTVAESHLHGVTIYNMGFPAIGIREYHHLFVTEAMPLDPDVVLVNLFMGNDFSSPMPERGVLARALSLFDRDNILVFLLPRRLRALAGEGRQGMNALESETGPDDGAVLTTADQVNLSYPWVLDPLLEKPVHGRENQLKIEGFSYRSVRLQSREEIGRRLEPIRRMRRQAGATPVLVMLIPSHYQVEDDLWHAFRPTKDTDDDRRYGHEVVTEWLEKEGVPTLDLLPVLRGVPPMPDGSRHLFHLRDTHFNTRGNNVVGEALGDFLRPYLQSTGQH